MRKSPRIQQELLSWKLRISELASLLFRAKIPKISKEENKRKREKGEEERKWCWVVWFSEWGRSPIYRSWKWEVLGFEGVVQNGLHHPRPSGCSQRSQGGWQRSKCGKDPDSTFETSETASEKISNCANRLCSRLLDISPSCYFAITLTTNSIITTIKCYYVCRIHT